MIELDMPNTWKHQSEQFDLLCEILAVAFNDVEVVTEALQSRKVFGSLEVRSRLIWRMARAQDYFRDLNEQERYKQVRVMIENCDFPMRTYMRKFFPFVLYFHGFPLYNKLPEGAPYQAFLDGQIPKGFLEQPVIDTVWNNILDKGLHQEDELILREDIWHWFNFDADPLCKLMPLLSDRFVKCNSLSKQIEELIKETHDARQAD